MDELPAERVRIVVVAMVTTVAVGRSHIERVLLRTTCQDKSAREKQERKNLKRSRASERETLQVVLLSRGSPTRRKRWRHGMFLVLAAGLCLLHLKCFSILKENAALRYCSTTMVCRIRQRLQRRTKYITALFFGHRVYNKVN
jgi:hypothetical protein